MKLIALFLLTSCASDYLVLRDKKEKITLVKKNHTLTLKGENINPIVLRDDVIPGYYQSSEKIIINSEQIHSIIITKPSSTMGQKILNRKDFTPWINASACVKKKDNKYLVSAILENMKEILLGCIK